MLSYTLDGPKLRQLRERQRLTVAELAEKAGHRTDFQYRLEQGRRQPSRETADALAEALGCTFDDIMKPGRPKPRRKTPASSGRRRAVEPA